MNAKIGVEEGTFFVRDFETNDDEIVSFFGDMDQESIREKFERSLKVGVVALKTIGTTERIDYIEKSFYRLDKKFEEVLRGTMQEIEQRIVDAFGEGGTVPGVIDEYFGENGKIVKDIFDPTIEGTPLCTLRSLISEEIGRLRTELGIKEVKEKIEEVTPLKGYAFEDVCDKLLSDIVRSRMGDAMIRTTGEQGRVSGSFKGDFVATLGDRPDCRIVFETKDVQNISLPEIHRTMQEAIENRDAKYGVLVARFVESLPQSVGWFNEYHGNFLVCALGTKEHEEILCREILFIVYSWARIKVLLEEKKAEGLDVSLIQSKLKDIESNLAVFRQVRTECTNVETAVGKIGSLLDTIQQGITQELTEIKEEIMRVRAE